MMRTFAAHDDLVHDPASGLTHRAPDPPGPPGGFVLDDAVVAGWAVVAPADLHRTIPASVCWSPIVRCNLHCPQCLDDTTVPELGADQRRTYRRDPRRRANRARPSTSPAANHCC